MILVRALAALIGALLILMVLGLFLLGTPGGSAWVVGNLVQAGGERLSLSGIRGTLLGGLAVDRLKVRAGRTSVIIEPAELRLNWPDLLRRQVRLGTARADLVRIDVAPRPPDEPRSVVEPLLLPVAISVDSLEIRRLVIRNGVTRVNASTPAVAPAEPAIMEVGPVTLRGRLVDGVLKIRSLRAALYGIEGEARGSFGTGEPFAVDVALDWQVPQAAVTGSGKLSGNLAALRFEQVVRLPSPVGIGGIARLLGDSPEIVAEARWAGLDQPLGEGPQLRLRSDAGRLRLQGWTDRYTAELEGSARLGDWPAAKARARAEGDTRELRIRSLGLDGFGGEVTGTGRMTLREALAGRVDLQGRRLDPRFLDPRLAGRVDFRGAVMFDALGNFKVEIPEAAGTLFGRPLRASGTVVRNRQVLAFDDVQVRAGVNRVELSGRYGGDVGDRLAGQFRVDAPDLATLWPDFKGQLRGSGKLGGTVDRPLLDLDLDGSNLRTGDLRIASLKARGALGARQRLDISVQARGLALRDEALGDLAVGVEGSPGTHAVSAALTGSTVEAQIHSAGSYARGVLAQTIETGEVTVARKQRWTLQAPSTLRIAGPEVTLGAQCWISGNGGICLDDARYGPRGFGGSGGLRNFPLASLGPFLPADIRLAGTATALVSLRSESGRLTGSLKGSAEGSQITWLVPDDEDLRTEITGFRVDVGLTDEALDFDAEVAEGYGLRLATKGRVIGPFGDTPTIAAEVSGGVPDLASLGPLLERIVDVGDVKGRITVAATLTGNARQPDIAGGVVLEEGAFTVPAAGITVDRVSLALRGRKDGQLELKGNARSGKGYVALDGTVAWRDQLFPTAVATVKGRVVDVIRLPEGLMQVSPDVRVVLKDRQFRVSGEMQVPRAEIRLKELGESAVEPSPDTVVHGRTKTIVEKSPPLFVLDDLRVRLGDKVSFEGFGLKTGLAGGLRLNQSLAADPGAVTADGVVSLRNGQFTAFGQRLGIDRGSLIFSGVVTDPGVDVKASRTVTYLGRDVTAGVLLSGTLSRIQTQVFSEPAMGELDALSYLTTGKPVSAAGAGDRQWVSNAALTLGLNQALPVVQDLGSTLRVDEIGLDTSQTGTTAVTVGEQLGKNLFIRYSYGIFDKLGTVKATYRLGRRISIEGTSGTQQQALDLIYSINW